MPRKKLIRRFEPRFGVSAEMLELEAKYIGRELEDYLLLSTNDLKDRLTATLRAWRATDAMVEGAVTALPERDRLAVLCLIVRDLYHILELFRTYLRCPEGDVLTPSSPPTVEPVSAERAMPFSEWLFNFES